MSQKKYFQGGIRGPASLSEFFTWRKTTFSSRRSLVYLQSGREYMTDALRSQSRRCVVHIISYVIYLAPFTGADLLSLTKRTKVTALRVQQRYGTLHPSRHLRSPLVAPSHCPMQRDRLAAAPADRGRQASTIQIHTRLPFAFKRETTTSQPPSSALGFHK